MLPDLLSLYHTMPGPARQAVVRMRGEYLRWLRYGPETEALVSEAATRESWTADQWRTWQEGRLAEVLSDAARHVPYYRDAWAARRRRGERSDVEQLANWPTLDKEALRAAPRAFLSERPGAWRLAEHTSGSTGKPLDLWWSLAAVRYIFAMHEAYCSRWYGVSRHDPWAMLGGQLVVPARRTEPPFWVWNAALNQLYMSSYHLAPQYVAAYCEAIERHGVRFVAGYTSSLYQLALAVLESGRPRLRLAVAVTHAEAVAPHQREAISEAFGCDVCETYGNAEAVSRASACRHRTLHLWPQVGVVETVDGDGQPVVAGPGDLLCTGLQNPAMPLVRYAIGDRARLAPDGEACHCGRSLPILASVDGRVEDTLYSRDGRAIQRFHAVPIGVSAVREVQVVQETLERIRLRVVASAAYAPADERRLAERLRDRVGDVDVVFERLAAIPREPNGKFKAVVCLLPEGERRRQHASRRAAPVATDVNQS
ncbi:MAG: phenylacetate--CoA ligase family protein [Vicinamibacterales bacterium]